MRISYNPLWKMLIDKNMNKRDLAEKCKISTASVAKLSKGANITTDVLLKSPGTVLVDSSFLMRYNTSIHINRQSHRGRFSLTPNLTLTPGIARRHCVAGLTPVCRR